jgi:hypothetical protein
LPPSLPLISPFGLPAAGYPASARWHVFMYAGFKRIAPEQDTGMDLNEPWITALELFNVRKRS